MLGRRRLHSRVPEGAETPLHLGGSLTSTCARSPRVVTLGRLDTQPQHGLVSSGPSLLKPAEDGRQRGTRAPLRAAGPCPSPPMASSPEIRAPRLRVAVAETPDLCTRVPSALWGQPGHLCERPPDRGMGVLSVRAQWPRQCVFLRSDRCHCHEIPRPAQGWGTLHPRARPPPPGFEFFVTRSLCSASRDHAVHSVCFW